MQVLDYEQQQTASEVRCDPYPGNPCPTKKHAHKTKVQKQVRQLLVTPHPSLRCLGITCYHSGLVRLCKLAPHTWHHSSTLYSCYNRLQMRVSSTTAH